MEDEQLEDMGNCLNRVEVGKAKCIYFRFFCFFLMIAILYSKVD